MNPAIVDLIMRVKRDSEYFIALEQNKSKKFSLDKPEEQLNYTEREIRWHLGIIQILDLVLSENLQQKKEISALNDKINEYRLSNSIMANAIKTFNERLSRQEKVVSENFSEINDDIIDLQQTQEELQQAQQDLHLSRQESLIQPRESTILEERRKSSLNIKPPSFNGNKNSKPIQFLKSFHEYVKAMDIRDNEFKPLIRNCLQETAKNWFFLIDEKVNNIEDFEKLFRERFWNEPIQSQMQSRFELGKFERNGKLTRVLYAQELIGYAQQLELKMTEAELVKKIGRHFVSDRGISRTIRMQNIEDFGRLFDLLQEFDNDTEEYKERMAKKPPFDKFNKNSEKKSPEKNPTNEDLSKTEKPKGKFYPKNNYNHNNGEKSQEKNNGSENRYKNKEYPIRSLEISNSNNKKNNNNNNCNNDNSNKQKSPDIQVHQGN